MVKIGKKSHIKKNVSKKKEENWLRAHFIKIAVTKIQKKTLGRARRLEKKKRIHSPYKLISHAEH